MLPECQHALALLLMVYAVGLGLLSIWLRDLLDICWDAQAHFQGTYGFSQRSSLHKDNHLCQS